MKLRVAIFGGSFDPVHNGHIDIAKYIVEDYKLDKFYFVPSNVPPHKIQHVASNKDRLKMLLLVKDHLGSKYFVSDFEFRSERRSYTYDTLQYFRNHYQEDTLYFVVGSDIFSTIKTWKRHRELLTLARFIIVERVGTPFKAMADEIGPLFDDYITDGNIILYKRALPDISSSILRDGLIEGTVPNYIENYINVNKLY